MAAMRQGSPQSANIFTCISDQLSQAAVKMILFLNVPNGDEATMKLFQVLSYKLKGKKAKRQKGIKA
jgi:hypothetical protein